MKNFPKSWIYSSAYIVVDYKSREGALRYIVEAFDKETELLDFEVELPGGCEDQLAKIMAWSTPQRGHEGYNLSAAQLGAIEAIADREIHDQHHIFQLTCNAD